MIDLSMWMNYDLLVYGVHFVNTVGTNKSTMKETVRFYRVSTTMKRHWATVRRGKKLIRRRQFQADFGNSILLCSNAKGKRSNLDRPYKQRVDCLDHQIDKQPDKLRQLSHRSKSTIRFATTMQTVTETTLTETTQVQQQAQLTTQVQQQAQLQISCRHCFSMVIAMPAMLVWTKDPHAETTTTMISILWTVLCRV